MFYTDGSEMKYFLASVMANRDDDALAKHLTGLHSASLMIWNLAEGRIDDVTARFGLRDACC
ncbi:hypothetical protein [Hansschlegelia zhihuaiae]|uniref:hypothetical protein n=1 Tax=Hansschlegelia zhihuaiae TaxID=405005 RepID=UPI000FFEBA80|nr:hypothetical protein [Hansschlegelia zhihuaiae]